MVREASASLVFGIESTTESACLLDGLIRLRRREQKALNFCDCSSVSRTWTPSARFDSSEVEDEGTA
jgi:hypothetical protein